jgi:hypothetical protein
LNYLSKSLEHFFLKHNSMDQKVPNILFCDVTKVENWIKNFLLYRKRTRKVHLNIFASVDQIPSERVNIFSSVCLIKANIICLPCYFEFEIAILLIMFDLYTKKNMKKELNIILGKSTLILSKRASLIRFL